MAELDIDDIQRRMDASLASLHNRIYGASGWSCVNRNARANHG